MYTVLTGAKKNIGDFLITDRCKKLLQKHRPDRSLYQLPHWENLDHYLDQINKSKAVIIMGGPGFQPSFYPKVYKLVNCLDDLKIPVIPMGLGWKGFPGDYLTLKNYRFNKTSLTLLEKMSREAAYISCRDYMTKKVLNNSGIRNVLMTGCPVWYDIDSIGKEVTTPTEIKKLIFTPAQAHIYKQQSIDILRMLKKLFSKAELYCSFHRGIDANDEFTPKADELNNQGIKKEAIALGYQVIDASYDLRKIEFYDHCDMHVGYRVHGHIYFLSKRKPSILIHEDGRGRGVSEALNVLGVDGFERLYSSIIADKSNIPFLSKNMNKIFGVITPNQNTVDILEDYLLAELENQFARFTGVGKVIDAHYEIMKKFIINLP